MFVALVLGMVLGYLPESSQSSAVASSTGPAFPSGLGGGGTSAPTTTQPHGSSSSGGTGVGTTTAGTRAPTVTHDPGVTTVPRLSTTVVPRRTTTVPPTTTTTLPVMRTVVLQTPQTAGSSSTPEFTISQAPYEFGYAYDCQAAPSAEQSFQVVVVTAAGPAATPAFFSRELKGAGTAVVGVRGAQKLEVETAAACEWVLRVVAP
jgi:hypothetical protein